MRHLFIGLLVLAACTGSGGDGNPADAGLPACTGALYDVCLDQSEHTQCASMICRPFNMLGQSGCTQACSTTVLCPNDPTGAAARCNTDGQCRPDNLRACEPPP